LMPMEREEAMGNPEGQRPSAPEGHPPPSPIRFPGSSPPWQRQRMARRPKGQSHESQEAGAPQGPHQERLFRLRAPKPCRSASPAACGPPRGR
jgi:hypothetical protein